MRGEIPVDEHGVCQVRMEKGMMYSSLPSLTSAEDIWGGCGGNRTRDLWDTAGVNDWRFLVVSENVGRRGPGTADPGISGRSIMPWWFWLLCWFGAVLLVWPLFKAADDEEEE